MIDPKLLRQSAVDVAVNLARRGYIFDADEYLALQERRKVLQVETQQLQSQRNSSAKAIGMPGPSPPASRRTRRRNLRKVRDKRYLRERLGRP